MSPSHRGGHRGAQRFNDLAVKLVNLVGARIPTKKPTSEFMALTTRLWQPGTVGA